ncbi:MAG: hypothetical protein H5T86_14260 [Armatimonadetes bacterium]|nr:hypothetical protein [Armatimonadota bacterium]
MPKEIAGALPAYTGVFVDVIPPDRRLVGTAPVYRGIREDDGSAYKAYPAQPLYAGAFARRQHGRAVADRTASHTGVFDFLGILRA